MFDSSVFSVIRDVCADAEPQRRPGRRLGRDTSVSTSRFGVRSAFTSRVTHVAAVGAVLSCVVQLVPQSELIGASLHSDTIEVDIAVPPLEVVTYNRETVALREPLVPSAHFDGESWTVSHAATGTEGLGADLGRAWEEWRDDVGAAWYFYVACDESLVDASAKPIRRELMRAAGLA